MAQGVKHVPWKGEDLSLHPPKPHMEPETLIVKWEVETGGILQPSGQLV